MKYRKANSTEYPAAAKLVRDTFMSDVASAYSEEGVQTFMDFATATLMQERDQENYETFVAVEKELILGVAHVRDTSHVSMFFVEPSHQGTGIGRNLLKLIVDACETGIISVHSSPNAKHAYERLGFLPTDTEQQQNGILFIPMKLEVNKSNQSVDMSY